MKSFKLFESIVLEEGSGGSAIKKYLNAMQEKWNDNSVEYIKRGVWPILSRPFSHAKRNAVLVLGLNHAATDGEISHIQSWIKSTGGRVRPVFDYETKQWDSLDFHVDAEKGVVRKGGRVNKDPTAFLSKEWRQISKTGKVRKRPSNLSELGSLPYFAALNKVFEILGIFGDIKGKLSQAEIVPFASKDINKLDSSLWKESMGWIKLFLKTTKPKVVVTSRVGLKTLIKHGLEYKRDKAFQVAISDKRSRTFFECGWIGGTPIVALMHWSSSQNGTIGDFQNASEEEKEYVRNFILHGKSETTKQVPILKAQVDNSQTIARYQKEAEKPEVRRVIQQLEGDDKVDYIDDLKSAIESGNESEIRKVHAFYKDLI